MRTVNIIVVLCLFLAGCAFVQTHATSWSLTTRVAAAGGSITSPNMEGSQTSRDGSVTATYLAGQRIGVTVTPASGYMIASLTMDGRVLTLDDPAVPFTTTVEGHASRSVLATFLKMPTVLSAAAGPDGTVAPARIQVRPGPQSPVREFVFTPADGFAVARIQIPGHGPDTDYQLLDATTGRPVTLPAATGVRVKVSIFNVRGSAQLTGTFAVTGASAGPAQTVLPGATVVLDGSAGTGSATYAWRQTGGPVTVTLSGATSARATFVAPPRTGTYRFTLETGGNGSATTTVTVTRSVVEATRRQCQDCHDQQGVGVRAHVFSRWSSAVHTRIAAAVVCSRCHTGAATGGHPGPARSSLGRVCANCHRSADHPFDAGTRACTACHDPHSASPYPQEEQVR